MAAIPAEAVAADTVEVAERAAGTRVAEGVVDIQVVVEETVAAADIPAAKVGAMVAGVLEAIPPSASSRRSRWKNPAARVVGPPMRRERQSI